MTLVVALTISSLAIVANAGTTKKSLYERIGIHTIAQAASNCIDMEFADSMLLMNETVKMEATSVPKPLMKYGLTSYMAHLAGGPQVPSIDVAALDKALNLTPEQRAHAWEEREVAFTKAGMRKADFMELKAMYLKKFDMAKPMMPSEEKFMKPDSLYARLGGIAPLSMVVNDFVDKLAMDSTVMSNKNVVKSLTSGKVSVGGIKYLVTEQLAAAAGGPFKYTGRTMKESHKDLMISEKEWQASAGILKNVLDMYKVPAKEQGEIFAAISASHNDIVKK